MVIDDDFLDHNVDDILNMEENKYDDGEDNQNEGALYDKSLFAAELGDVGEDDDIDFDWDKK